MKGPFTRLGLGAGRAALRHRPVSPLKTEPLSGLIQSGASSFPPRSIEVGAFAQITLWSRARRRRPARQWGRASPAEVQHAGTS